MKDPQQIVNVLMWVVIAGLGFAVLCTIIYYTVYRKRLPCIEDEHRKIKPKDVYSLKLVGTPVDQENEFMKNGGAVCPVCGSDDVDNIWLYDTYQEQPHEQDDKLIVAAPYFCRKCESDFTAVFELKYLEAKDIELGDKAKENEED